MRHHSPPFLRPSTLRSVRPLRVCAIVVAWLALAPAMAGAAMPAKDAVRLAWGGIRGIDGAADRSFACDTVGGAHRIVLAFVAPESLSRFVAMDVVVDISTTAVQLPPWWEFKNSGSCRTLSLSMDIHPSSLPDSGKHILDPWDGGDTGIGVITGYGLKFNGDPRLAELALALARPISKPTALEADKTYFACTLVIDNRRTMGEYACAGCDVPVRIKVKSLKLYEPDGRTFRLEPDASSCISWQGAMCEAPTKITEPPGE